MLDACSKETVACASQRDIDQNVLSRIGVAILDENAAPRVTFLVGALVPAASKETQRHSNVLAAAALLNYCRCTGAVYFPDGNQSL